MEGDTLEAKGEKQLFEALGTSFSLGKTPGEQLYTQNYAAGIELIRKYVFMLKKITLATDMPALCIKFPTIIREPSRLRAGTKQKLEMRY
jgi:hypothetical protein